MKTISLLFFGVVILTGACSSSKKAVDDNTMQIISAGYSNWSQSPIHNSDVPEGGIDLAVIVKNWPDNASPEYIIYHNRKSFRARITDTTDIGVAINARIVTTSSVLRTKSEKVDLSDRLVFKKADGTIDYLAIKEWNQIKE